MRSPSAERARLKALLAALEDPRLAADLQTDELTISVARRHRLSPLLSIHCGRTLPSPLIEPFRRDRLITTANNMILGQVAEECIRAFSGARIRTIVLKGLDYEARLYRTVGARPTSDIDILVEEENRRPAFDVLDKLGFEPRAAAPGFDDPDYHEVAWTRAGQEVDLHLALAPPARCHIDYASIWAEAQPFGLGRTETSVLAPVHAAIFHALHMAIDHFAVPGIYLLDLTRLLPTESARGLAEGLARHWRCYRPMATALALRDEFLPRKAIIEGPGDRSPITSRIVDQYGVLESLPRIEQLFRKIAHFDSLLDTVPYLALQSRRNVRERFERYIRKRSPRDRLALAKRI